ncbi:MAG: glutamyl-tRNA synthetase [Flavobacteriaceae bacterium]|jgi:glutamyl-tRNA synthetase
MSETKKIVTRFAPSPTGNFHVGSARTALFNFLFARHNGGTFILRSEDTDKERSKEEFELNILESFEWLGLSYDEFYRQSDRLDIYKEQLQKLLDNGTAYEAEDSTSGEGKVIRFKNPNTDVTFNDAILGDITYNTTDLGDFVIARSKDLPLYHFVVVVDDFLMNVTHVIRAQEHLANTPRQILIGRALGATEPIYAHIPIVLAPDKSKLSKRHGATNVMEFKEEGYLPNALVNFLALIGWNPGGEKEVFTLDELIGAFTLDGVQKSGGVFNKEKLDWFNKEHIALLDKEARDIYLQRYIPENIFTHPKSETIISLLLERVHKGNEITELLKEGDFEYLFKEPSYNEPEKLVWKKSDKEHTLIHLQKVIEILSSYGGDEDSTSIKEVIFPYAEEVGTGDVLWPLRFALSGKDRSPDPFTLIELLGVELSLVYIKNALETLKN